MAEIGSSLREVDFIAKELYLNPEIEVILSRIYEQILVFCVRATQWYIQISKGFLSKMRAAITKTWPLEFGDIKDNIDMYIQRLRNQATIANQVEVREIHLKLIDVYNDLRGVQQIQQTGGQCFNI